MDAHGVKASEKEMGGKQSEVEHEAGWTAATARLKITYMHHGRTQMYVYGTIKCRDDEDN